MVSCLGRLGSYATFLPLSFLFCCAASAEVMLEDVERTYSRAAEREGRGEAIVGQRAFWIVEG